MGTNNRNGPEIRTRVNEREEGWVRYISVLGPSNVLLLETVGRQLEQPFFIVRGSTWDNRLVLCAQGMRLGSVGGGESRISRS